MHDIWNPWHGCIKKSEGYQNCYMMYLDKIHQNKEKGIFKTAMLEYPLKKNRDGSFKIKSGELIRVCMTSDFFLEEADKWRNDVWKVIKKRSDVIFYILTKRPERIANNLPEDWNDGYDNVFLNVTCENQARLEERMPIFSKIKAKVKGIMIAPILGPIDLKPYLKNNDIKQVICGGENYGGCRPCNFDWVKQISQDCKEENVNFSFIETGTKFIKDGRTYTILNKRVQSQMAFRANVSHKNKDIDFILKYDDIIIQKDKLYKPKYTSVNCLECGSKMICNGCVNCGRCKQIE